ncbi:hypothetical protein SAMN03159288_02466 [Rhizobium sp. NFACC06-2]|nr:hypothetical protein SAMN03159288_02466 [Rhizobium sp. NFACC06-2]
MPTWIIMIQGGSTSSVSAASDSLAQLLSRTEAAGPAELGLYRLKLALSDNAVLQSVA